MPFRIETDACFASGNLSEKEVRETLSEAAPALDGLRAAQAGGTLPLLSLPGARDDLAGLETIAARYRGAFDDVVVLGTGGASLGGQAVTALAGSAPRLRFLDNIDPESFTALFRAVEPARTGFIVISKSGGTAETLAQFLTCRAAMKNAPDAGDLARHFIAVSEPTDNPLRRLAARDGIEVLAHDPGLGGRYSVLSLVGMLPAMIAGLDAAAFRAGAGEVLEAALADDDPELSPPALGAAIQIALARHHGVTATVMMPYADRLRPFASWFRQLWAESLGKGGQGTTPVAAVGAVDQHSQLQLYLDGPRDKLFTLVLMERAGSGAVLDVAGGPSGDPALSYLAGRGMGDLMAAAQRATAEALARRGRPVRIFRLPRLDERALGAMMMHFMLETILAGRILGVDPFDQPAVEEGKILARQYLSEMQIS
ncbi:MAG: glucose-6-phosphate isomerase [Alphaproteobacteria bacterium]